MISKFYLLHEKLFEKRVYHNHATVWVTFKQFSNQSHFLIINKAQTQSVTKVALHPNNMKLSYHMRELPLLLLSVLLVLSSPYRELPLLLSLSSLLLSSPERASFIDVDVRVSQDSHLQLLHQL